MAKQDEYLANNQKGKVRCGDNGIFKGVPLTEEETQVSYLAHQIYNKYNSDGIRFTIDDSSDFINDDDYEYLQKFSCQSPASTLLSLPELHGFSEA